MRLSLEWLSEEKHCLAHGGVFLDSKITRSPRFSALLYLSKALHNQASSRLGRLWETDVYWLSRRTVPKRLYYGPFKVQKGQEKSCEKKAKGRKKERLTKRRRSRAAPLFTIIPFDCWNCSTGENFHIFFFYFWYAFNVLLIPAKSLLTTIRESVYTNTHFERRKKAQNDLNAAGTTDKPVYTVRFDSSHRFVSTPARM